MYKIFSVDNNRLAVDIADELAKQAGETRFKIFGNLKVERFSDGEFSPQFMESVRNKKVFLVASTINPEITLKLLLTIQAAKLASASEIILIIPYLGYSRQDRKEGNRGAIGAKLMATLYEAAGATKVISIDLHSEQIQGFFNIPVNMIPGGVVFGRFVKNLPTDKEYCVCSPDAGGVKRAMRFYQKFLQKFPTATFVMMSKIRTRPNEIERMDLIGDVSGKHVLLLDDMVDTAGTLAKAAKLLKQGGALSVTALISHGVLSGKGRDTVDECEDLDLLVITDSIPQRESNKIKVVGSAHVFAKAIESIVNSISMDANLERAE